MTLFLTCPECQSKLKIPDTLTAKQIQCPKCSARFVAPENARSAVTTETSPSPPQGVTPDLDSEEEILEEVVEPIRHKGNIRRSPTEEAVSTIIPYKNARALIAYYLGVFSLIPC